MDADLLSKWVPIASSIFFAGATLWLGIRQYFLVDKTALREEYKFAKNFFEEFNENPQDPSAPLRLPMHAFARQKGFQAIAGSSRIKPSVVQHLMSFIDPVSSLQDYSIGKSFLTYSPANTQQQFDFTGWTVATPRRRKLFLWMLFGFFLVSYMMAASPYFLWSLALLPASKALALALFTVPVFGYFALISLFTSRQLNAAKRLIEAQNDLLNHADLPNT